MRDERCEMRAVDFARMYVKLGCSRGYGVGLGVRVSVCGASNFMD